VVRVSVPIDVGMIAATTSSVFALATPLRVDELLAFAVVQAIGQHAPPDKRDRSVRATLAGFRDGRFVIAVDGRIYDRADAVVVAAGVVTLRFYSTEQRWRRVPAA
jgi:hypothetical protein